VLVGSILGALAFGTLATLVWLSIVTAWLLVGVLLFAFTLRAARLWAGAPRALAASLLGECVPEPRARRRKPGVRGWLGAAFADVDAWRAVAFVVVSTPITVAGAYLLVLLWGTAVTWATYPVWWSLFGPENTDATGAIRQSGMQIGEFYFDTWPSAIALSLAGIALLFAIPWVAHGVATVDRFLVRGLLGPTRTSDRVDDLEVTRAQAVDQSAATLRRIERNLHDGTQARLVALAMHLDMARDQLAGESPEEVARARELLDRVHRDTLDTIAELREVTRSIHPPALDRGLEDALATMASRSGVPTDLSVSVPVRPSPAIETIAYYCAAELLTNVAKHAAATRAAVAVSTDDGVLRVEVRDDGRGGAAVTPGGGLAGLAERVGTVDGRLTLSSPVGGPTVAVVELPFAAG
jgi:signal transduction histidine kinase